MRLTKYITAVLLLSTLFGKAQQTIDSSKYPAPVNFTTAEDQQNMLQQLGIKKLRPGPSGDEKAPNHAPNYKYFIPWATQLLNDSVK